MIIFDTTECYLIKTKLEGTFISEFLWSRKVVDRKWQYCWWRQAVPDWTCVSFELNFSFWINMAPSATIVRSFCKHLVFVALSEGIERLFTTRSNIGLHAAMRRVTTTRSRWSWSFSWPVSISRGSRSFLRYIPKIWRSGSVFYIVGNIWRALRKNPYWSKSLARISQCRWTVWEGFVEGRPFSRNTESRRALRIKFYGSTNTTVEQSCTDGRTSRNWQKILSTAIKLSGEMMLQKWIYQVRILLSYDLNLYFLNISYR